MKTLDGILFAEMIESGAASLRAHAAEVDELNVFPIPDGDTGDNMLLTMQGGLCADGGESLSRVACRAADGMLMSARGNSGVILSQFFDGLKIGFEGLASADAVAVGAAFRRGVEQAYRAVMTPTEGTILTVMREATEAACREESESIEAFLRHFLVEARASLARTPSLLPKLKQAGVVDSGGAGLIYIVEGMLAAITGERDALDFAVGEMPNAQEIDLDAFDENSTLTLGYCTELLLRLQTAKVDLEAFEVKCITDYLQTIGDSVVTVRNGSLVKLHVHTATPHRVLEFCQRYGEFLKVKIENMSLQHNSAGGAAGQADEKREAHTKAFGLIAVACGDGLKQLFLERGADLTVNGGQSMNPSTEDFIEAFECVPADVIFVLPNNGNILLTARQAAQLYEKADVRVIDSRTLGAGYAALSMFDPTSGNADEIEAALTEATEGVVTAEISRCIRDAQMKDRALHCGDYIGFVGENLLAANADRFAVLCEMLDRLADGGEHEVFLLILGREASRSEAERAEQTFQSKHPSCELYLIEGGQEVYDYILIAE